MTMYGYLCLRKCKCTDVNEQCQYEDGDYKLLATLYFMLCRVVTQNMKFQSTLLSSSILTVGTCKGLFSNVNKNVSLQIIFSCSTIMTMRAGKGLFTSMCAYMYMQTSFLCKAKRAIRTAIGLLPCMGSNMVCKASFRRGCVWTEGAVVHLDNAGVLDRSWCSSFTHLETITVKPHLWGMLVLLTFETQY